MNRTRDLWQPEAACLNLSITEKDRVFFPGRGRPNKTAPFEQYCGICPVIDECLEFALVHEEEGVWGGTTSEQRKLWPVETILLLVKKARTEGWEEKRIPFSPVSAQPSPRPQEFLANFPPPLIF